MLGLGTGTYLIPEVGVGVWGRIRSRRSFVSDLARDAFGGDGRVPQSERGQTASPTLKVIRSKEGLMVTMDESSQVISVSD